MKRTIIIIVATALVAITASIFWLGNTTFSQTTDLPKSKLALKGKMGFVIESIDAGSPLIQAGLRPGDIIMGLNGQLESAEQFQSTIFRSEPGTILDVWYVRFNPTTGKLDEQRTKVKTIPFTSQAQPTS